MILAIWKSTIRNLKKVKKYRIKKLTIQNLLTLIRLGDGNEFPWYILLYNILVSHPNFMNFADFS